MCITFPTNYLKKVFLAILLTLLVTNSVFAQYKWIQVNALHIAYDTNGSVGDCLFPMDDEGNITLQEVVQTNISKDSTMMFVTEFLKNEDSKDGISVSTPVVSTVGNNIDGDVEMNVGKELVEMPYAGMMERHVSQISFKVHVEVKDGRFRYTLTKFYTNRRTIHGEGKSEGPSNLIHWQRVNSLTKERDAYDREHPRKTSRVEGNLKEFDDQIAKEIKSYEGEYDAVHSFITELENCCVAQAADDDW